MPLPIWLLPLLAAGAGAGIAKSQGKDPWKGAGLGALLGGFIPGAAVPGFAASAAASGGTAAGAGLGAGAAGAGAGASATGGAQGLGLGALMKQAGVTAGVGAGMSAAMPQYGMTQIGSVPQMPQEDPMAALQQLINRPKMRGGI